MDRRTLDVTADHSPTPARRVLARAVAGVWTIGMLVVFWSPPPPQPRWTGAWIDEAVHATSFLGFAIVWWLAGLGPRWIAALGVVLAITTELVQPLLPWPRTAQIGDVLADAFGIGIGLVGLAWLRARRS